MHEHEDNTSQSQYPLKVHERNNESQLHYVRDTIWELWEIIVEITSSVFVINRQVVNPVPFRSRTGRTWG